MSGWIAKHDRHDVKEDWLTVKRWMKRKGKRKGRI